MKTEHEASEPAAREQSSPTKKLAYSISVFCGIAGDIGRSTVYEEIKDGKLIARKVRGRTIILHTDGEDYLANLPTTKDSVSEPEEAA